MFLKKLGQSEIKSIKNGVASFGFLYEEEILLDYFSDIKRLKDFHQIEKTNSQKIVSRRKIESRNVQVNAN
ncbi:hypothetical protein LEP1GSC163_0183 [Leptospira santarosai str. CBC379]|nr:hypothetical protein LEP1GSC163_0183 [Leptospira santarosai str. CBC379]